MKKSRDIQVCRGERKIMRRVEEGGSESDGDRKRLS